jgi:hypothetical protein
MKMLNGLQSLVEKQVIVDFRGMFGAQSLVTLLSIDTQLGFLQLRDRHGKTAFFNVGEIATVFEPTAQQIEEYLKGVTEQDAALNASDTAVESGLAETTAH